MKTVLKLVGFALAIAVVVGVVAVAYAVTTGLSARGKPGRLETRLARAVRGMAGSRDISGRTKPGCPPPGGVGGGVSHLSPPRASVPPQDRRRGTADGPAP